MRKWLADRIGIVRLRQLLEGLQHRLAFVPLVMTALAVVLSQLCLLLDHALGEEVLPGLLSTTVASARVVLGTIAGGLITAFTLLVSMMLVAVQLASGQFSPRTLRNWLSDPTLRRAVGIVMGTTVFCLLGLRSARDLGQDAFIPNITVVVAVLAGIGSLVMVVRAVDHVTTNLQVGTVVGRIAESAISVLKAVGSVHAGEHPTVAPVASPDQNMPPMPSSAVAIEAKEGGWVQQIDTVALAEALPEGSTAWVPIVHGAYVVKHAPLAWVDVAKHAETVENDRDGDESLAARVRGAFALGDSRTMQRDIGFGLSQLADIAVRALSPGINDPQTAQDVVRHLGEVTLALWSYPEASPTSNEGHCTIHQVSTGHRAHLRAAFDPIRRYGRADPAVMLTLARTLIEVAQEVKRRNLPGAIDPLRDALEEVRCGADPTHWLPRECAELEACRIGSG